MYPALAIAAFAVFSRVVVGEWFVTSGFFVPENKSLGDPLLALKEVGWGVKMLSGTATIWIAAIGLGAMTIAGLVSARRSRRAHRGVARRIRGAALVGVREGSPVSDPLHGAARRDRGDRRRRPRGAFSARGARAAQ